MEKICRFNLVCVTAVLLFLTTDCKKEKFTSLPVVGTISMTSISDTYAESKSKINADGGATVTARGVCWNMTSEPTSADSKTTDDKPGTGTFMSKITGLTPGTTYHLRAFATNEVGTSYSDEITFSTKSTLPTLTTTAVSAIAATTATSGGNIATDGGAAVIARGVCWGTTANPTTSNLKTTDGTGTGVFTSSITGLSAGTVYHIRAYATNSLGTSYGSDITFSTSAVLPSLTTSPVTAITSLTASSGGNITSDGGAAITARGVCWSTTANPVTTDSKTIDGTGTGQFVSNITGLTAGATYHLRAYATNSAGTAYGADISFVTSGQTPSSVSQQATNLSISGATLNGVVNPNYLSTTVTFEYGLTTTYGQTIAAEQSPLTGSSITNVSANISGLTQGTTYHFRVKTVNSMGTVYSGDMSFVTLNFATLNTIIISGLTSTTATSGGNIITDGGAPVSARGVCWNTAGNPTVADNKTADGSGTGSFVSQVTSLLPATTYFVRSYATNTYGTSYGNQITFTTLATPPTLSTEPIVGITTSAATGGGNITSDGGASVTARGVCWSTSPDPTTALSTKTSDGTGAGVFTSSITGLAAGTTYHVRAYATNSAGTTYGADVTFITLATLPTLTTNAITGITATTAGGGGNITSDGGALITARGVCWSTSPNPTVSDSKTSDGTGTGSFVSSITGLTSNTTYYVRAYATNSAGTTYGADVTFATIATIPTNGLVGYWPFNGNANDESGNGHNGTVTGAFLTTDRYGVNNEAYNFDGISDYIYITNSSLVSGGYVTISLWINTDGTGVGFPIIAGNQNDYNIFINKDSASVWIVTNLPHDASPTTGFTTKFESIQINQWNHIVLNYDGNYLRMYINNVLSKSIIATGQVYTPQPDYLAFGIYFLNGSPSGTNTYKGKLDDVRIYNRALNTNEIQALYHEGGW